jgi:hypothetical protein
MENFSMDLDGKVICSLDFSSVLGFALSKRFGIGFPLRARTAGVLGRHLRNNPSCLLYSSFSSFSEGLDDL